MYSQNRKTIFIVDDDDFFSELLRDHIERNPRYNVETFHTGEECLVNLYKDPDLIILDYYLDKSHKNAANGLEILKEIKKANSTQHIIMLSGQEQYGVALQTMASGAEYYIQKDKSSFDKVDKLMKELLK